MIDFINFNYLLSIKLKRNHVGLQFMPRDTALGILRQCALRMAQVLRKANTFCCMLAVTHMLSEHTSSANVKSTELPLYTLHWHKIGEEMAQSYISMDKTQDDG